MSPRRATPCIGVCSTTYGDLVCRGCKRFGHEVVGWNGYTDEQRDRIWERLARMTEACVAPYLHVLRPDHLRALAAERNVAAWPQSPDLVLAYELLRFAPDALRTPERAGLGLKPPAIGLAAAEIRRRVDAELYRRSIAQYEYSFKIAQ